MTAQTATARDWLRCYRPRPAAAFRLICLPFASGSATFFRSWAWALPEDVEVVAVQYPGRLDRIGEPAVTEMHAMVDSIVGALPAVLDRPVGLFGHSMGGAIAFEVAVWLGRRYGLTPRHLFVSGRPAPRHHRNGVKHRGPDDVLWQELCRLGGTASDALEHAELRAAVLPALRGDYQLIETYRPSLTSMLEIPITALVGDADPELTPAEADDWRHHTTADFRLRVFPGDHFYLQPRRDDVLREVAAGLGLMAPRETP